MAARLLDFLPPSGSDADDIVEGFLTWAGERQLSLYDHQEEAILELLSGSNVILATPTGSGKSLVALAAHARSIITGNRSWYTAPVKALVSEKFFDLCEQLGADNVGMLTGDTSVNADAPVICCTTEILALAALRDGAELEAETVVLDEFHFYGDPDRGWAWQVPLLELPHASFLLLSATLGNVDFFVDELTNRTGKPTAVVSGTVRPVPLSFEYERGLLHHAIEKLLAGDAAPLYLVNFSQKDAVAMANAVASVAKLETDAKEAVSHELHDAKLPPGFGRDLGRLLRNGVGVHHAGMLPRYRRLVERLTQQGLLRVISGTDTLGIGVNLPIRTVVLTRLYKYDGTENRLLSAREFHQIAGRAGHAGYDTSGRVVAMAPDHVAENEAAEAKAANDPKKKRKLKKSTPPRNWVHYDDDTFAKLQESSPERLHSSFTVTPGMLLHLLERPGDTWTNVAKVLTENHEPRSRQRRHIRRTIGLFRSLRDAGIVEVLPRSDEFGRRVRVNLDLQADFALNQPLAPFVLHAIPQLDVEDENYPLAVLALVESVLDNPFPLLLAQKDRAKDEKMAAMKASGVEYDERIAELEKIDYPKPMADALYASFDAWREHNRWIESNIAPKGVVRDLWDHALDFGDFVRRYKVKRSEGLLLRYLSDCYKALLKTVPEDAKTDEVWELIDWLEAIIRSTDSSLVDEWEAMRDGGIEVHDVAAADALVHPDDNADVTRNAKQFRTLVRTRMFRLVQLAATTQWDDLADEIAESGDPRWNAHKASDDFAEYFAEHETIGIDADARGPHRFVVDDTDPTVWRIEQLLADPEGHDEWYLSASVDLDTSRDAGAVQLRYEGVHRR